MKLKDCPFCGNKPTVIYDKQKHGIGCSNAACIVWLPDDARLRELNNTTMYIDKELMTDAWNKRVISGVIYNGLGFRKEKK